MNIDDDKLLTMEMVESTFAKGQDLPVMPEVGAQLIALRGQEDIEMTDLVRLIESDPVISGKIVAYASSPFFSYQGKLESVQEAVFHVLGVDLSMNIALAMAIGNQFKGPIKGPVGAMAIWNHSVYCAVLSQAIASKIKNQPDLKPGTAYLYGLLHNIGFLALGHMFSKKFTTFNKILEDQKESSLDELEQDLLGISHTRVGSLLMNSWSMPNQYNVIVENHHNCDYEGPHQAYTHISFMANALLKTIGVGDADGHPIPSHLLKKYDLTESQLNELLEIVVQWQESIDHLAKQLVA